MKPGRRMCYTDRKVEIVEDVVVDRGHVELHNFEGVGAFDRREDVDKKLALARARGHNLDRGQTSNDLHLDVAGAKDATAAAFDSCPYMISR